MLPNKNLRKLFDEIKDKTKIFCKYNTFASTKPRFEIHSLFAMIGDIEQTMRGKQVIVEISREGGVIFDDACEFDSFGGMVSKLSLHYTLINQEKLNIEECKVDIWVL